ncbi:MAG: hypothetical protein HFI87_05245 [Bacilli bacterium]|nr:hypothetical protein [Bacilli bacterium]
MENIDNSMIKRIEEQFATPKDLNKRQISVFLKPETIEELDKSIEKVKEYSDKKITRNTMIELAVGNLIECIPIALKNYEEKNKSLKEEYDTVVFPCDETGVATFIRTKSWFYVRTDKNKIDNLKYIALYTAYPVQSITHYGVIDRYEPRDFNGKTKYIYYLKGEPIELAKPIPLGNINPQSTRSPRYTTLKKLKAAKEYADLAI